MKTVVVDASLVLGFLIKSNKIVIKEFPRFLQSEKNDKLKIISLALLPLEVANGLRFSHSGREMTAAILEKFINLPIKLVNLTDNLLIQATDYAYQNKTTVYDTAYHLLAISRNSTLLTCDWKYYLAAKQLNHIKYIG